MAPGCGRGGKSGADHPGGAETGLPSESAATDGSTDVSSTADESAPSDDQNQHSDGDTGDVPRSDDPGTAIEDPAASVCRWVSTIPGCEVLSPES